MAEDKTQGFSLIEVLAAVAILALVALPLLGMFTAAMQSGHAAQVQTVATLHAQYLMEETIAAWPPGSGEGSGGGTRPFGTAAEFFSFTWVLDRPIDLQPMRRITITITWNEARGPRSYRVVTLVE